MSLARAFIGAGDVNINPFDPITGVQTGYKPGGSADKFAIKANSTIKSKKSKSRDGYGQTIATVALAEEPDLTITFGEVNQDNIRLAFMARQVALAEAAGGTINDEALVASLDKYVPLAHKNLGSTLTVKHTSGTPVYVLGTDYEVNYRMGWIRALSGGQITQGQSLKVSYVSNAISGITLRGSTDAQLRTSILFDGKNQVDGSAVEVEVYEAVLTPSGEFDFLADDWGALELTGKMTTPLGRSEPYVVRFKDAG
jgi:hypothetical protein